MKVRSPITGTTNCELITSISSKEVIDIYKQQFNLDISRFFKDSENIYVFRCLDSLFEFYYPFGLEGDEEYYKLISKLDWYYNPSRWEHKKALDFIKEGNCILEVGTGSGSFLEKIQNIRNISIVGLELNKDAINVAKKKGIEIIPELIEDYATNNTEKFDVVCSFQVLEHVSNPISFLKSSIDCLKKNGILMIGIPNNNSYIKYNKLPSKVLNMPPHHVGLWSDDSIRYLQKIFPLNLQAIYFEPLIDSNVDPFIWNFLYKYIKSKLILKLIWKIKAHYLLRILIRLFKSNIKGSSMLVVFRKVQ